MPAQRNLGLMIIIFTIGITTMDTAIICAIIVRSVINRTLVVFMTNTKTTVTIIVSTVIHDFVDYHNN